MYFIFFRMIQVKLHKLLLLRQGSNSMDGYVPELIFITPSSGQNLKLFNTLDYDLIYWTTFQSA